MMEGPAFLPLPQGLRITEIHQEETELTVEVLSERTSACCPLCERSSDAVHSWYQRRLKDVPCGGQAVRLSTSGSLGVRLATRLGIATSWMTILRRMMALPTPAPGAVTVLGIDDFSFKRGRKFGTILVDLELHQVIDVLAERSSQTSAD